MKTPSKSQPAAKEDILNAFWAIYQTKSIEKITIREIMQAAGYNRGTFYNYFTDIYDALNQLQDTLFIYAQGLLEEYRKNGLQYQLFIQYWADIFFEKASYFSVFLGENRDPDFSSKMKAVMRPVFYEIWGLSQDDETAPYIFEFVTSAIIGVLTHWYKSGQNISSETFFPLLHSMLRSGALSEVLKLSQHAGLRNITNYKDLVLSSKDV